MHLENEKKKHKHFFNTIVEQHLAVCKLIEFIEKKFLYEIVQKLH